MKKPTNKVERDALIKELQAMTFNELPKRWEELGVIEGFYVNEDCEPEEVINTSICEESRSTFPTSEQAEASIYLAMLMQLRDVYREGWVPDWELAGETKYSVTKEQNQWKCYVSKYVSTPFSFQTQERAELFLENFGDYLEKIKPLFS